MTTTKDVYHLIFDIECKIIKVPTNQDIFHEEYTLEDYQKDVEYHRIGKIHLAEGNEISASMRRVPVMNMKRPWTNLRRFSTVVFIDINYPISK